MEAEKYVAEHPYVELTSIPQSSKTSPSPTKSSATDYRYLTELAKKWSLSSKKADTARKQCISARDKGIIYKNGKATSIGLMATLIKRDLETFKGFQACLDGFRR